MKFMNGLYAKVKNQMVILKDDETGSQTLEWLGIAAVIVIVVGFISNAFDSSVGEAVANAFKGFIEDIAGE